MMMVEAFDTWRTAEGARTTTAASSTPTATPTSRRWSTRRSNSPAVIMWSIGNEIPDSTSTAGTPDRQAADRRHQGGRHHAPDRDRLRQVPQRARPPARRPTRSSASSTASASTTTPRRRSTRCTRTYPTKFLFESESSSETSTRGVYQDPDQLNTGENYTPGKRGDVLLRQQPRLVDDERRVRPQEGPRPQVLPRRVPVVGHRLHRRADAVQRVPGQGVVLRRGRHRRLPEGHVLPVPQPVDDGRRWSTCCR